MGWPTPSETLGKCGFNNFPEHLFGHSASMTIYLYTNEQRHAMNKQAQIDQINEAITRSSVAVSKDAKAELVNGKVAYSYVRKGAYTTTRIRATFMDILSMLNGEDIRTIKNITL